MAGHFSNFCEILLNSADISKFRGKGQIPWLSLKFRSLQKTVGPSD